MEFIFIKLKVNVKYGGHGFDAVPNQSQVKVGGGYGGHVKVLSPSQSLRALGIFI